MSHLKEESTCEHQWKEVSRDKRVKLYIQPRWFADGLRTWEQVILHRSEAWSAAKEGLTPVGLKNIPPLLKSIPCTITYDLPAKPNARNVPKSSPTKK